MTDRPQVVANYLKKVLQEMTEPLVPFSNYTDFRDLPSPDSPELLPEEPHGLLEIREEFVEEHLDAPIDKKHARLAEIHDLVNLLPPINRNTLEYLCKFFNRVSQHSEVNSMTSARIAALMMLSVIRAEKQEPLHVGKSGNIGMIFLSMITYPDEIFREGDFGMP
jgi:RhoGAP domain